MGHTAIGAGIGALLGAIIGGGKGAAIGAAIGAGGGAGSVYVQGRDDLELSNGTEFTIRASAPPNE
ncbi:MAG TPA: YMGG-like glycine zipper-containing protein [Pyrinomonadaceae bacterium]